MFCLLSIKMYALEDETDYLNGWRDNMVKRRTIRSVLACHCRIDVFRHRQ